MTEILKFHSVPRWQAPGSTLTGSCGAAGSMAMMERNWMSQKSHVRLLALLRSPRTPGNLHVLSVPLISPILNISHKGKKLLCPSRGIILSRFIRVIACIRTSFWVLFHGMFILCVFYLFIHRRIFGLFLLSWVVLVWAFTYGFPYGHMFSFFLCMYLGVDSLDQTIILI